MPADGRYSSLGKCNGTIRIGSFIRVIFLFALRVTFLFVVFFAPRFTGHLRPSSLSRIALRNRQVAIRVSGTLVEHIPAASDATETR